MTTSRTVRPLLRARTSPPRPSTHILSRPRLLEQMDAGSRGAVTLVCGGPGTGKSHLVIDWVRRRRGPGVRVAWAALGADCNDPQRLWTLFLASLERAGLDSPSLTGMRAPTEVNDAFLDRLLLALEDLDAPVVVVLEDLHEVSDPRAVLTIDTLVRLLPDCVHLVMITRSDPPLSLHRLRVGGGLSEIRHADLAFTRDEAVALLGQHRLTLDDPEVERLMERTEGWAVGLRLAALTLQRCTDNAERARAVADFAGDSRAVADYLVAEVLDRLPEDLRRFLLQTSVVERVDAGLAEHLTGTSGGAEALERLETAGVPLLPLDDHRGWYRYHRLVQELCRQRLHAEDPALVTRSPHPGGVLVRRARGVRREPAPGAGRARLVGVRQDRGGARRCPRVRAPRAARCAGCWPSCPRTSCRTTRGSRPCAPSSCTAQGRPSGWPSASSEPRSSGPSTRATTHCCTRWCSRWSVPGRPAVATTWCSRPRSLSAHSGSPTPSTPAWSRNGRPSRRTVPMPICCSARAWSGRAASRRPRPAWCASRRRRQGPRPDPVDGGLLASAYLSLVLAMRGALGQATAHAEHALALGGARGWSDEIQSTSAWLSLALVHLQRGDPLAARRALDEATMVLERRPDALLEVCRILVTARLLGESADPSAARGALLEARRILDPLPEVPFLAGWCLLVQADHELTGGRPDAVLALLDPATSLGASPAAHVLRGRALLRQGRGEAALAEVEPVTIGVRLGVAGIEALVVTALAQESLRQDGAALLALTRALQAAEPEGWVRPFLRDRERLTPLLERYRTVVMTPAPLVDRLLAPSTSWRGPPRRAHRPRARGATAPAEHDEQRADRA